MSSVLKLSNKENDFDTILQGAFEDAVRNGGTIEILDSLGRSLKRITVECSSLSLEGRLWKYITPGDKFEGDFLTLDVLTNGDLKISANEKYLEPAGEVMDWDGESIFMEAMDEHLGYGFSLEYSDGGEIICFDVSVNDDSTKEYNGPEWHWSQYAIRNIGEALFEDGYVILTLRDNEYTCPCGASCKCDCFCHEKE